jgi:hypothetical protein
MKTAIEWYQKAIFEILKEKENLSDEIFLQNMLNAHLQAKEMEKQEQQKLGIILAILAEEIGDKKFTDLLIKAEQYYNKTYGK